MKRALIYILSALITFQSFPGAALAVSAQSAAAETVTESPSDDAEETVEESVELPAEGSGSANVVAEPENENDSDILNEEQSDPAEEQTQEQTGEQTQEPMQEDGELSEEAGARDGDEQSGQEKANDNPVSEKTVDPAVTAGEESETADPEETESVTEEEFIYVNPMYEGIVTEDELIEQPGKQTQSQRRKAASSAAVIDTLEAAGEILCENMIGRAGSIVIRVDKTASDFSGLENRDIYNMIIRQALVENEDCRSGDYLRFQYAGFRIGTTTTDTSVELRFTVTYFTTAEQETEVDTVLEQVMGEMDLQDKEEAEKILQIYSYITDHVTYDSENLNVQDYTLKYSAYAALIDGKAVCQGYATLFYRMCREAGLSARVIAGTGTINSKSGVHTWNIVRIGELYYNADPTWDAGLSEEDYQWFLKSDGSFVDHVRDSDQKMDYTSAAFYSEYPMSDADYEFSAEATGITLQPEDVLAAAGDRVVLHIEASGSDISYRWQWRKEGTSWRNCTSAGSDTDTFSFNMKASLDGRIYRCVVTGSDAVIPSEEAHITLDVTPLEITVQPGDVSAFAGDRVVLHVEASGSDLSYQWQYKTPAGTVWKNCTSAGYNTDTFSFIMKASLAGRYYRCLVSGNSEAVMSNRSLIMLEESAEILVQPEDVEAAAGDRVTLHLEAEGNGISYQWQYKTASGTSWRNCTYTGYNTDTFSFLMKASLEGRSYRCVVTDPSGTKIISEEALISLKNTAGDLPEDLRAYEQLSCEYNSSGIQTASFKYGNSVRGRDLVGWSVAPQSYDRTILLNFEIHGWEDSYAGDGQILVDLGNAVVDHYSDASGLSGCRLIVIPSCNPDGLADGTTNYGFGRCNADGIDLNRDFDVAYQPNSSSRNYTPYAFSGKESAALRDLVYATNPYIAIDFHGWEDCTIGNSDVAEVFALYCGLNHKYEFTDNAHGYFAYWAQAQGAKGLLVEFESPGKVVHSDVIEALDHLIQGNFGTESTDQSDDFFSEYCPITTYAISSGRVYVQKEIGNTGTDHGYIDGGTDLCTIVQVYDDGWCKVRYPVSSYTKTGYCEFSEFYAEDHAVTPYRASVSASENVYRTSDLSVKLGSVWTTDEITVIAEKDSVCQIIYPLDDGGYKMGWISIDAINRLQAE